QRERNKLGQKVHPIGFRVNVIRDWESKWFADKEYPALLLEDHKIRKAIKQRHATAAVSRIDIERQASTVKVTLHTAKPGIIIGRGGKGIDDIRAFLENLTKRQQVHVSVAEIKQPDLDAQLVAENIAAQISRRVAYKRAVRQTVMRTMRNG